MSAPPREVVLVQKRAWVTTSPAGTQLDLLEQIAPGEYRIPVLSFDLDGLRLLASAISQALCADVSRAGAGRNPPESRPANGGESC
ncbi:MAG TPA: hypothetical protein VMU04_02905 [Candidatus Acidoferrum sp.]|nr:hypothetical protein [Candidatus Acidoferrum sp.]